MVRLDSVTTFLGRGFPVVSGRICNNARGWSAESVTITFAVYNGTLLPTLDRGSHTIPAVSSQDCRSYSRTLTLLQPWRTIVIDDVRWTWKRE